MSTSYLTADISRIHFIHNILEWCDFVFTLITVNHIINSDKPYIMLREIVVCVMTNRDIISA